MAPKSIPDLISKAQATEGLMFPAFNLGLKTAETIVKKRGTDLIRKTLLAHVLLGYYDGAEFECSCGEKCPEVDEMAEVEYTPRLAITVELRWHAEHVALILGGA